MQFKQESQVYTADGQHVGRIDRVVLNPKTKEVTHIVVRKGFLFTEDKLLPLSLVESTIAARVTLRLDASALDELPLFEETHYIPLAEQERLTAGYPPEMAPPLYWYLPMGNYVDYVPNPAAYRPEIHQNIPEDAVAVKEGANVISADDTHVGNVERVFTDSMLNRVTYILISHGILLKEKKAIPVSWVRTVSENEIRLNVSAAMLEGLHEYEGV